MLCEDEAGAGDPEHVREFVRGVRGIGAGENAAGADDSKNQNRVGDAGERVDADTVAGLEACMA